MKIPYLRHKELFSKSQLLPLAIIAGVFAVSLLFVLLTYRPSASLAILLAGISLVAAFVTLALKNMAAALTIVLLTSATLGITIDTGRATPFPLGMVMIMLLTVVWFLKMLIIDRRI